MLAIVSPGQGSQSAGFLRPWLDLPGVRQDLDVWSAAAGLDLLRLGVDGTGDQVRDTAVAQPLLVAAALLSATSVGLTQTCTAVHAGHSVGELASLALVGALTPTEAVVAAAVRGRAMAAACAVEPSGMAAVLGGDPDEVLEALTRLGLEAANRNAAGQVVAAGTHEALDALRAAPPAGARVRLLAVAGAFHTPRMASARAPFEAHLATLPRRPLTSPLLSNADGDPVVDAADALARVGAQVTSPVRWDLCSDRLLALGVTGLLELAPGGTLAGLAKRSLPGVEVVALRSPDDLDRARALLAAHSRAAADHPAHGFTVVVAPRAGRLVRDAHAGAALATGDLLGEVVSRGGPAVLAAHAPGLLLEWLAEDGDPVSAGQALARVEAAAS